MTHVSHADSCMPRSAPARPGVLAARAGFSSLPLPLPLLLLLCREVACICVPAEGAAGGAGFGVRGAGFGVRAAAWSALITWHTVASLPHLRAAAQHVVRVLTSAEEKW